MTANPSQKPTDAARGPTRKIVYWFLLVLAVMGLLPLGVSAYKLISYSREVLVTSQQEVQLQVATAVARQLNAGVEGVKAQMARLGEAIAGLAKGTAGAGSGRAVPDRALMERLLGSDLLLVRYTPREGDSVEARQPGFPRSAVDAVIREGVGAAMQGGQDVSDPLPLQFRPMPHPPGSCSALSMSMYRMMSAFSCGVSSLSPNTGMFCGPLTIAP